MTCSKWFDEFVDLHCTTSGRKNEHQIAGHTIDQSTITLMKVEMLNRKFQIRNINWVNVTWSVES